MAKGCDTAAYLTDSRVDALVGKGILLLEDTLIT